MSEMQETVKNYVCPACFAREIDVCMLHYDEAAKEYYCTKCAYAGTKDDVEAFFDVYRKQKYKRMGRSHPAMGRYRETGISWPEEIKHADGIKVTVNGVDYEVLETESSYFVPVVFDGPAKLEFRFAAPTGTLKISPARLKLSAEKQKDAYCLLLDKPRKLYLEVEGLDKQLLLYASCGKTADESADYYFAAGKVYEIGTLVLKSGESLYVEAGAVIRGRIRTEKYAENIRIGGYGILDAGAWLPGSESRTILVDCCKNVLIEDITIIHTPCWHIMLAGCDGVTVRNVKEIGEVCGSDGVDIVGSRNVTVEDCMLRNNDDCIAVKAFEGGYCNGDGEITQTSESGWNRPVENILIQNCIFLNETCGNGVEIGHELQVDEVKRIVFRDLDIVRSEGFGAALSIHAGDHAVVRDIVFENIYIENYSDFLIDFRVMRSRFNKDEERGHIRDVSLKNIHVRHTPEHWGYTISVIGGWDKNHKAENIRFENFFLGDQKVTHGDLLDLHCRYAENITFC